MAVSQAGMTMAGSPRPDNPEVSTGRRPALVPRELLADPAGRLLTDPSASPAASPLSASNHQFLEDLVKMQLIGPSSAGLFLKDSAGRLEELATKEGLTNALIQAGLLTAYQLDRV